MNKLLKDLQEKLPEFSQHLHYVKLSPNYDSYSIKYKDTLLCFVSESLIHKTQLSYYFYYCTASLNNHELLTIICKLKKRNKLNGRNNTTTTSY